MIYCPICQNLIAKPENERNNSTIVKDCQKCGSTVSFHVQYKFSSRVVKMQRKDLTNLNKKV